MNGEIKKSICTVIIDGKEYRGEYTGYSEITGKYHISLYNGEIIKLSSLDNVKFN